MFETTAKLPVILSDLTGVRPVKDDAGLLSTEPGKGGFKLSPKAQEMLGVKKGDQVRLSPSHDGSGGDKHFRIKVGKGQGAVLSYGKGKSKDGTQNEGGALKFTSINAWLTLAEGATAETKSNEILTTYRLVSDAGTEADVAEFGYRLEYVGTSHKQAARTKKQEAAV